MICVKCSKYLDVGEAHGSMKHPYCEVCFNKEWGNNYNNYLDWVDKKHNIFSWKHYFKRLFNIGQ